MLNSPKITLRRQLRRLRAAIPLAERRAAATALVRVVLQSPLLRRGRCWALYLPFASELDCRPLALALAARGKTVYLPLIAHSRRRTLRFAALDDISGWRRSTLGMFEPLARRSLSARQMQVICLPLLGFDRAGGRLGQGGGYYDATLVFRRHPGRDAPLLLGLAYAVQEVSALPTDAWDVRLDWVATEGELVRCLRNPIRNTAAPK